MSAQLVDLSTPQTEICRNAIDLLEDALGEIKAGNYVAVAFAALRRDGTAHTGHSGTTDVSALLGAVAILQHKVVQQAAGE